MKKFIALLCTLVFLFGSAVCEEEPQALLEEEVVEETIVEEEPEPESEPIIEEEPDPEPIVDEESDPIVEEEPESEPEPEPIVEESQPEPEVIEESIIEPEIIEEPPIEELPSEEASIEPTVEPVVETSEEILSTSLGDEEIIQIEEEILTEEVYIEEEPIIESEETIVPEELFTIDDDDWGYLDTELLDHEVHITFLTEPQYFGDIAELVVTLVNFRPEEQYTIYWQYCVDPYLDEPEWQDIEDEHDRIYSFIIDKINYEYGYRVLVIVEE